MREAQLGKLVVDPVVARPVLEARPEPVRRGVDAGAPQRRRDGVAADGAAVAAVEHVPAAVALKRGAHHGDGLAGKRHPVRARHLHALGRHRPDGGVEVELVRPRAADLRLPRDGQHGQPHGELGERRARVDPPQGRPDFRVVQRRVVLHRRGALRQFGQDRGHRVVVRPVLAQGGPAQHGGDMGAHRPRRGVLADHGQGTQDIVHRRGPDLVDGDVAELRQHVGGHPSPPVARGGRFRTALPVERRLIERLGLRDAEARHPGTPGIAPVPGDGAVAGGGLARVGEAHEVGGPEPDVAPLAVDDDPLDPGFGAGFLDAEHESVAVDEDAGLAGAADLCHGEGVADESGHGC